MTSQTSFLSFLVHCFRRFSRMKLQFKELLGVLLLLLNFPVGWGGALLCSVMAERLHIRWMHIVSVVIYGLSWGMLFLGAFLAGPKAAKSCKTIIPSGWKAYRRHAASRR